MSSNGTENRVRVLRLAREWSQAELARRTGISRAAVSAIEGQRLVPSVSTALSLSRVLGCSVEELFSEASARTSPDVLEWAWTSQAETARFWFGQVEGRTLLYPAESTVTGELPHDGLGRTAAGIAGISGQDLAEQTLILAGCDPAAGILARLYERTTGYRMLVFSRSSRQALLLLQKGLIHVAGVHLSSASAEDGNCGPVKSIVTQPVRLLRVTSWEDGVAVGSGIRATTTRGLLSERLTWIGREPGSGARQCLDELLQDRPAPRRMARDHRGVAEAIQCGWADAGVCLRLVAEEAGLRFLPIRTEAYDLCYLRGSESDPRLQALQRVVQSRDFRQQLGELPGYDCRMAGELCHTQ